MKRVLLSFCLALLICSFAQAEGTTTVVTRSDGTTQMYQPRDVDGISVGYIKSGSREVGNIAWHPDISVGFWGMGLDINIALGENKPSDYENVVLRFVEYDDKRKGLRYGVIDNLTWGHGMLINGYSTRVYGPVLLNNEQMALTGYVNMGQYAVRGLGTRTGIYGVRLEERINPLLTLGQTIITDVDGVTLAGTTETQKVTGVGVDASVPLPLNFEGYAEWAQLVDHGSGFSTGLSWGYDLMVANAMFLTEYRVLDKGFVPGYFNANYEANPVNLASAEATGNSKNGYMAELAIGILGLASIDVAYEDYNDSDSAAFTASLFSKLPGDIEVAGYYKQPDFVNFRSLTLEEGATMGGSITYPLNPYTRLIAHYKKSYDVDSQQIVESQYYELRLSI
jgi:hypothetical protein